MKKLFSIMVVGLVVLSAASVFACEEHEGKKHKGFMKGAEKRCEELGMKPGSDEFRGCMKANEQAMKEHKEMRKKSN
ncbi:MAG: hypothetical protein HY540_05495 [Deltaproteobacteria bacterium]|nr:hypothetical protein [Deltaproteobacteria bacterium]